MLPPSGARSISWVKVKKGCSPLFFLFPQRLVKGKLPVNKSLCTQPLCASISLGGGIPSVCGKERYPRTSCAGCWVDKDHQSPALGQKVQELSIEYNSMARKEHWKHKYLTVPPLPPTLLKQSWSGREGQTQNSVKVGQHGKTS